MATLGAWWQRLVGGTSAARVTGRPPSSNGASSFHLGWDISGPASSVAVTLEVLEPPTVEHLYFWALQANFVQDGRGTGGAHLGLQWHPSYPGSTAVNWGGYRDGGGELAGSPSPLSSTLGNPNTRDYVWAPRTAYRLAIERAGGADPAGQVHWQGSVTDLSTGVQTVVRELLVPADTIGSATMWSEVFARCDDPPVTVRWSDPSMCRSTDGWTAPGSLAVNYQSHVAGGCANTNSWCDRAGVVQRTSCERSTAQGTRLPIAGV